MKFKKFSFIIFCFFFLGSVFLFGQTVNQNLANGINAFHNGDYVLAKEILSREANNNSSLLPRYYLGLAAYKLGEVDAALTHWENIITLGLDVDGKVRQKVLDYFNQDERSINYSPRSFIKNPNAASIDNFNKFHPVSSIKIYDHKLNLVEYKANTVVETTLDGLDKKPLNSSLDVLNNLRTPWDIIDVGQNKLVSDFGNDKVYIFDSAFSFERDLGSRGIGRGGLLGPKGLAADPEGNIYVSESGNSRVQVFNKRGESIETLGQLGSGRGEFINPSKVIYHSGGILVLDSGNRRIQNFSHQYEFLWQWGQGRLRNPNDFTLVSDDLLFVLDEREIFYLDLNDRNKSFPLLRNPAHINDSFLALAYDDSNNRFYVSNLRKGSIEVFNANDDLAKNYQVHYNRINLARFPLVTISFEVENEYNRGIDYLENRHFAVYENDVKVPFVLTPKPDLKQLVFLVEKSPQAERFKLKTDLFLKEFFKQKNPQDLVKVVSLDSRAGRADAGYEELTPFIREPLVLQKRILDSLAPSNPSLINNLGNLGPTAGVNGALDGALDRALDGAITSLLNFNGNKAIVLLAYQNYPASAFGNSRNFKRALDYARANHIPIYVFYLGAGSNSGANLGSNLRSNVGSNSSPNLLANLAASTEGKFYSYNDASQLTDFFANLDDINGNLYQLTYKTIPNPNRAGVLRRVKLRVGFLGKYGEDDLIAYPLPR